MILYERALRCHNDNPDEPSTKSVRVVEITGGACPFQVEYESEETGVVILATTYNKNHAINKACRVDPDALAHAAEWAYKAECLLQALGSTDGRKS